MARHAAAFLIAMCAAGALAAGGTPAAAPPAEEAAPGAAADQAEETDEATLAAVEAFELLVRSPYDPDRAFSLVNRRELREEEGDIKWPLAHAFALARAGESVRAAGELERLARRLREGVGLEVQSFKLVARVAAFGAYEEDGRQVLHPGDRAMAYAEVVGFACEPAPETGPGAGPRGAAWRVSLEVEFTLENLLTGERVASWGPDVVEHVTRSEVHDLHVTRVIELPEDLAPGEYELKVGVRDSLAEDVGGVSVRRLKVAGR